MNQHKPALLIAVVFVATLARANDKRAANHFERAAGNAKQAQTALAASHRYVLGWQRHADPHSGLIPRNLDKDRDLWNGKDSAADNYPFMVLTTSLTDRPMFEGRMREMLATERRITSRLDNLVDAYSFSKRGWYHDTPNLDRMIFESSEYCKDGLMPLTEWLGQSAWSNRMIGIIDSIWRHAPVKTDWGPIPSAGAEVNGEMMQITSRVYWMTGNQRYLDGACRIADYYLLGDKHPTRNAQMLRLRDHGCELISGLTEVYAACHFARADKARAYRQPLHALLDRVLEVGINEHGMMYDKVNPQTGEIISNRLSDNWGYNYNGYYTVYLLDGIERYRQATLKAMRSLQAHYMEFAWQGSSADGIADSVEGAINLYNREPVATVAEWVDTNLTRMLKMQQPDGVIEGWHGDGNFARTSIMYALWKQQGVTAHPWRRDVQLGAVGHGRQIYLSLSAVRPWKGRLYFDAPRHKLAMKLPLDYPRINQFPEWFTINAKTQYTVDAGNGNTKTLKGADLSQGWPVQLRGAQTVRLIVTAMAAD